MAITQAMCTSFKEDLPDKEMDMDADTIKIALYTSSATLNATTTAYTTSNEVANGNGYTTGGVALANSTARGALIYNDTTTGDKSIAVLDFGGDFTVSSGTFRIVFPAAGANAIIRIA